jgi:hypothetical protein
MRQTQDELYQELNRLGWYWQPKKKEWERDDTPAKEVTQLVKIRVWAATDKVSLAADLLIEQLESIDFELIEKSTPYQCRPPQQLESRIYLVFKDNSDAKLL